MHEKDTAANKETQGTKFLLDGLGDKAKFLLTMAHMNQRLLDVEFPDPGPVEEHVEIKRNSRNL